MILSSCAWAPCTLIYSHLQSLFFAHILASTTMPENPQPGNIITTVWCFFISEKGNSHLFIYLFSLPNQIEKLKEQTHVNPRWDLHLFWSDCQSNFRGNWRLCPYTAFLGIELHFTAILQCVNACCPLPSFQITSGRWSAPAPSARFSGLLTMVKQRKKKKKLKLQACSALFFYLLL